jgi:hypothetical protein
MQTPTRAEGTLVGAAALIPRKHQPGRVPNEIQSKSRMEDLIYTIIHKLSQWKSARE